MNEVFHRGPALTAGDDSSGVRVVSNTGECRHKVQRAVNCAGREGKMESSAAASSDANKVVASHTEARRAGIKLKTRGGAMNPRLCEKLAEAPAETLNGELIGALGNRIRCDVLGKRAIWTTAIRNRLAVAGSGEIQKHARQQTFRSRARTATIAPRLFGDARAIQVETPANWRQRRAAGSKSESSQEVAIARPEEPLGREQQGRSKRFLYCLLNVRRGDLFSRQGQQRRDSKAWKIASTIHAGGSRLELLPPPPSRRQRAAEIRAKLPATPEARQLHGEPSCWPVHSSVSAGPKCWREVPVNPMSFETQLDGVRVVAGRGELRLRPRSTGPGVRRALFETRRFD